jgi:hypothetical protein
MSSMALLLAWVDLGRPRPQTLAAAARDVSSFGDARFRRVLRGDASGC